MKKNLREDQDRFHFGKTPERKMFYLLQFKTGISGNCL